MRLKTRTAAYVLTAAVTLAIGGGMASAAFAQEAPGAGTGSTTTAPGIERQADGSILVRTTQPVAIAENTPVRHDRAENTFLVPAGTPVEALPGGGFRIGKF